MSQSVIWHDPLSEETKLLYEKREFGAPSVDCGGILRQTLRIANDNTFRGKEPNASLDRILVHENDDNGDLRVTLDAQNKASCRIEYLDWNIEASIEASSAVLTTSSLRPRMTPYYIAERLVLPFLRYFRGAILIHAGAVAIDGQGYALLAPSGVGKSTLTGAILANHARAKILSDDVMTVIPRGSSYDIASSQTHLAMRHEMWNASPFVEQTTDFFDKTILRIKSSHVQLDPVPLRGLFVLEKADCNSIKRVLAKNLLPTVAQSRFAVSCEWREMHRYQFKHWLSILRDTPAFLCRMNDENISEWTDQLMETIRHCS